MAKRLIFLLRMYVTLLLIFATQKLVFMVFNCGYAGGTTGWDWLSVLWHGLRLDSVTACYLLIVPAVAVLVSFFWSGMPMRRVLTYYYAVAAPLMALAFAADMVLYRFWGAKLDAADLMYAASPKEMLASVRWYEIVAGALLIGLLFAVSHWPGGGTLLIVGGGTLALSVLAWLWYLKRRKKSNGTFNS